MSMTSFSSLRELRRQAERASQWLYQPSPSTDDDEGTSSEDELTSIDVSGVFLQSTKDKLKEGGRGREERRRSATRGDAMGYKTKMERMVAWDGGGGGRNNSLVRGLARADVSTRDLMERLDKSLASAWEGGFASPPRGEGTPEKKKKAHVVESAEKGTVMEKEGEAAPDVIGWTSPTTKSKKTFTPGTKMRKRLQEAEAQISLQSRTIQSLEENLFVMRQQMETNMASGSGIDENTKTRALAVGRAGRGSGKREREGGGEEPSTSYRVTELEGRVRELRRREVRASNSSATLLARLKEVTKEREAARSELSSLHLTLKRAQDAAEVARKDSKTCRQRVKSDAANIASLRMEVEGVGEKNLHLQGLLKEARCTIKGLQEQIRKLETELDATRCTAVQSLVTAREEERERYSVPLKEANVRNFGLMTRFEAVEEERDALQVANSRLRDRLKATMYEEELTKHELKKALSRKEKEKGGPRVRRRMEEEEEEEEESGSEGWVTPKREKSRYIRQRYRKKIPEATLRESSPERHELSNKDYDALLKRFRSAAKKK